MVIAASSATRAPALVTIFPPTITSPAIIKACALARLSTSPLSTSKLSIRRFATDASLLGLALPHAHPISLALQFSKKLVNVFTINVDTNILVRRLGQLFNVKGGNSQPKLIHG